MATIEAKEKWNDTGYRLSKGKNYRFTASGKWIDWCIETDANGYSRWWLYLAVLLRRVPKARWFSLIGAIDRRPRTQFDIGRLIRENRVYRAKISGELSCFANDVGFAYGNNKGSIELEVEEPGDAHEPAT